MLSSYICYLRGSVFDQKSPVFRIQGGNTSVRDVLMKEKNGRKLEGVCPINNSPSTEWIHYFKKKSDIWHVTPDSWHLTRDTWHVTPDTWHVTCDTWWGVNILSKFQLPSSNGLGFMISWRLGGKGSWLNEWINELIKDEAVCRTVPATPGVLIILYNIWYLYDKELPTSLNQYT